MKKRRIYFLIFFVIILGMSSFFVINYVNEFFVMKKVKNLTENILNSCKQDYVSNYIVTYIRSYTAGCSDYRINLLKDVASKKNIKLFIYLYGDYSNRDINNLNKILELPFHFEGISDKQRNILRKIDLKLNIYSMARINNCNIYEDRHNPISFNRKIRNTDVLN